MPVGSGDLAKRLGISARVASRVKGDLVATGYLIRDKAPGAEGRGKPASELMANPALLEPKFSGAQEEFWKDKNEGGHFDQVIEMLLAERFDWAGAKPVRGEAPSRRGASRSLSASNRLLLMLLLGVADRGGVVRRLGPSVLAKMAGLTKVAFQGQIGKLVDLAYLRAVVAGVSGQSMFGIQPGAFFINLSHPHYKRVVPEAVLLYPVEAVELVIRSQGEAKVVYQQLQALELRGEDIDRDSSVGRLLETGAGFTTKAGFKRLSYRFDGIGTSTLPDYLQMKVEEYASRLLSHGQSQHAMEDAVKQLRSVIGQEIRPKNYQGSEGVQKSLVQLTLYLASRLAQLVRAALSNTHELERTHGQSSQGEWIYTIVPTIPTSNGRYLVITVIREHGRSGALGYRVLKQEEGAWRCQLASEDMPEEEQQEYGLLTVQRRRLEAKENSKLVRRHLANMAAEFLED